MSDAQTAPAAPRRAMQDLRHGAGLAWSAGALVIAALVLAPVIAVAVMALNPTDNIWPHLISTTLPRYFSNTVMLAAGTGALAAATGAGAAWLVTMFQFPGRRALEWLLLLPLAVPAYIGAYAMADFLDYSGPVQTALREAMVRRAVRAAEKIRAQDLAATRLIAFAHGSRFKPNAPSASRIARLSPATNDPRVIGGMAGRMAAGMYETGGVYTKCGVMLEGLEPMTAHQADLFAVPDPRSPALLAAIDGLNGRFGRNTMRLASEGFGQKSYDTKRAFKSPSWTTRIDQVPIAR